MVVPAWIAAFFAAALTVSGCGWDFGSDHSVRFNPYRTEREFGRLPPLPKYDSSGQNKLFSWDRDVGYQDLDKQTEEIDNLWDESQQAEADGRLGETRRLLTDYLNWTSTQRYPRWNSPEDVQSRRNSAIDKLDALRELDHGASESAVKAYLEARSLYDAAKPREEVLKQLGPARSDTRLSDNSDYLQAALHLDDKKLAAAEFERVAARYPRSEKREAALFMVATLKMKSSPGFDQRLVDSDENDPCENCRDKPWQEARTAFAKVMREYPRGRYYSDARGWLGFLSLGAGDKAGALVEYYRMLGGQDEAGRVEALFSLGLVRYKATESEMMRVEAMLEHEPTAALAYAYHNIYNFVLRSVYESKWYDKNELAARAQPELKRTASFATRMLSRYPSSSVGASFVVRVAEANLELGNDSDAARLARRAIGMGAKGEIRAEALWVAGSAEFQLHRFSTACQALTTLVSENPNNRYTEGARRQLAMLAEDTGDIGAALDQYLALDYRYDIAYFIDVLMTPEQLAAFIANRTSIARRDELLYALGVRYLRDRRWNEARSVFSSVKTTGRDVDYPYLNKIGVDSWDQSQQDQNPKERQIDLSIRGIRPQWIDQDLRTANDLERLEREVEAARDDEARAEALYQVASYQYERSLLFYNPLEWHGARHYLLVDLYLRGSFRQSGESQKLFVHMQDHDMAANSLSIFLEVVRRFPNTRAARDALFTAAICHERLREYNNYWRAIYSDGGHAADRMVTYRNVRTTYPSYRLPRGTLGWEPSTRTVNGGPGWDKPAKPTPRPSRWARAAQLADSWVSEGAKFANRVLTNIEYLLRQGSLAIVNAVRRIADWFWILTMICWLWFLWRRAGEARMLMNEALGQCESRPIEERGNSHLAVSSNVVSATLDKYLGHDLRDRWIETGRNISYKLNQVGKHARGRALIAFYAVTHALFAVLLMRLALNW